ncbi:oligogalacturonate-specific porin KdgM family protein [Serratia microhaemolytica]|uniref:oligogalacturonate-specific porin KdgM family protein n=1 Tax=Serratia microhaemolytica TaxID=2675110 RepID=UPI00139231D9|nr:oligogalacturonate-specific porin KdgM family protein [Serratia microhaemolytica]
MKFSRVFTLLSLCSVLVSGTLQATTIDYRHEYLADTEQHADRVRISHRFANQLGFALEAKWGSKSSSGDSRLFENNYAKGHEFELSYSYKFDDRLTLTPALVMESASEAATYKSQVKAIYLLTERLYTGARYRYGIQNYTSAARDNRHYHQGNVYLGYKFGWANLEYDFEYKDTDYPSLRGKQRTYLHNLVMQIPVNKEWVPYAELGYLPYRNDAKGGYTNGSTKYDNDFQLRYRVGVKYNF